jgi:hypothetical protein
MPASAASMASFCALNSLPAGKPFLTLTTLRAVRRPASAGRRPARASAAARHFGGQRHCPSRRVRRHPGWPRQNAPAASMAPARPGPASVSRWRAPRPAFPPAPRDRRFRIVERGAGCSSGRHCSRRASIATSRPIRRSASLSIQARAAATALACPRLRRRLRGGPGRGAPLRGNAGRHPRPSPAARQSATAAASAAPARRTARRWWSAAAAPAGSRCASRARPNAPAPPAPDRR